MSSVFKVLSLGGQAIKTGPNIFQLIPGHWDDFSFKTSFEVVAFDTSGQKRALGNLKIGYADQPKGWTRDAMPKQFEALPPGWFSLGQDVEYYQNIREKLSPEDRDFVLKGLGDVVDDDALFATAGEQEVFRSSLLRSVSLSAIHGQYRRVLSGLVVLTEFEFAYRDPGDERTASIDIEFHVKPASKPPTTVHVLIGRNGVGKTTLLNNMVGAIISQEGN